MLRAWQERADRGWWCSSAAPASGREACQERTLSLRYAPQASNNWCWAASGEMTMEWLGDEPNRACQCRQAEQVLGVAGCCAAPGSCTPAADAPARCDAPRWPAFVERPDSYAYEYRTTCDALPNRQDDTQCDAKPLDWLSLTAELCAGRPVIAALHTPGSTRGATRSSSRASRATAAGACWSWIRGGSARPIATARASWTRLHGSLTTSMCPAGAASLTGSTSTGSAGSSRKKRRVCPSKDSKQGLRPNVAER